MSKSDIVQNSKNATSIITAIKPKFCEITKDESAFLAEAIYAKQAINNNKSLAEIATLNPASFKTAFLQLATSSLTLDPAQKLAYLIPREGQVYLDVSYRGLMKMAIEAGVCKNLIVDLVFAKDQFTYKGRRTPPEHFYDPFADIGKIIVDTTDKGAIGERGDFRGVYVDYLLSDNSHMVYFITKRDISTARAKSASFLYSRKGTSVWEAFTVQMIRKVAIKSSIHLLPNSNKAIMTTIDYLNTVGGEGFNKAQPVLQETAEYDVTQSFSPVAETEQPTPSHTDETIVNLQENSEVREKVKMRIDKIITRCTKTLAFKSTLHELSTAFDFSEPEIEYAKSELNTALSNVFSQLLETSVRNNEFEKVKDFLKHFDEQEKQSRLEQIQTVINQLQECRNLYRLGKEQNDMSLLKDKLSTIMFIPLADHIRSLI